MRILFIVLIARLAFAQYDELNIAYDFKFFEVEPQDVESFNVRTFNDFLVHFTHNPDGEPSPDDILVPDSLLNPTGNIIDFTVVNQPLYWTGVNFSYTFSREPFGTGYYVGYIRTFGGFPAARTDWVTVGPFLLRISASLPTGAGISGN